MRRWIRDHSLSLFFLIIFLAALVGQAIAGHILHNEEAMAHNEETISLWRYIRSSDFGNAVMENWKSEYLQFMLFMLATIWLVERKEGSNWSTPYIWQHKGRTEIVTTGTGAARSYSLDGELLWTLSPMSSIVIPTPFSKFDLLYIASGYVGDQVRPVSSSRM